MIEKAVQAGEAEPGDFAYLVDRIRVGEGKLQVYGSQLIVKNGKLEPYPLEDSANVDTRRAAVGLGTLAEYLKMVEEAQKGH